MDEDDFVEALFGEDEGHFVDRVADVELLDDEVLLAQRPPSGLWGGLYCFPQFDDEDGLRDWLAQRQINADNLSQLNAFRHTFSHFHLDIVPMWLPVSSFTSCMDEGNALLYNLAQPPSVGLAAPVERLLQQLRAGTHV